MSQLHVIPIENPSLWLNLYLAMTLSLCHMETIVSYVVSLSIWHKETIVSLSSCHFAMSQQFYVITLSWQNFVIFYSPPMPRATNMFLYLAPTNLRLLDPKGLKWFERDLLHSQRVQRKGK